MNRENILSLCVSIIHDILGNNAGTISEKTELKDIEGYDSLTHISVVAAIEDEFKIKFSMNKALSIKKIGDFIDLISRRTEIYE